MLVEHEIKKMLLRCARVIHPVGDFGTSLRADMAAAEATEAGR